MRSLCMTRAICVAQATLVMVTARPGQPRVDMTGASPEPPKPWRLSAGTERPLADADRVVILLGGNDEMLTRLCEDVIAAELALAGYVVPSRDHVERAAAEHIAAKPQDAPISVSGVDVAKTVGADTVITGTVMCGVDGAGGARVSILSLQVVQASGETAIARRIVEWPQPVGLEGFALAIRESVITTGREK